MADSKVFVSAFEEESLRTKKLAEIRDYAAEWERDAPGSRTPTYLRFLLDEVQRLDDEAFELRCAMSES